LILGTDPADADTDGDGKTDFEELNPDDILQVSDPLTYDDFLTRAAYVRLYNLGLTCGAWADECPTANVRITHDGPFQYETMPYTLGMIVSSFNGPWFDLRDALGALQDGDLIGTGPGIISVIQIPGVDEAKLGRIADKLAAKVGPSRLGALLDRLIRYRCRRPSRNPSSKRSSGRRSRV